MKNISILFIVVLLGYLVSCAPTALQQAEETGESLMELMPSLEMPDGAEFLTGGGGGGPNTVGTGTTFRSELSLDEVYQHYVAQLSSAGWQLISEEQSETTITSTWQVSEEDGTLVDGTLEVIFGNHSSEITTTPEFADAYTVNVNLTIR